MSDIAIFITYNPYFLLQGGEIGTQSCMAIFSYSLDQKTLGTVTELLLGSVKLE